ncbi:phage portal protein [Heliorestis acidaminivorans]|uniref:Phage portal protein n=1 Tax=Heliorestis acidaminivorans TaxID=553427 RepID=A0A6I0EVU7_9FIRM|nr:phage portal protein [Heliorestis acidaminivorans]KAB2953729.1 phage portal protein [Heliorestis acidaminivorans]
MFSFLKNLFKARDKPQDTVSSAPRFFMGQSIAGKVVNERSSMQTTAVFACVRIIAETVASLPLHTYRYVGDGKEKMVDHPLYRLLHDEPNEEMTSFTLRETIMTHLLLWGNAYLQIIRNGRGDVLALYPLLPDKMTVDRDSKGKLYYSYNKEGQTYYLRSDDILHIPGLGFDGVMGYSPIALAKNAIGLSLAAEEYGGKFFANNARPSGILSTAGTIKDPSKVRDAWQAAYGGSGNSNKVAVLEEGLQYQPISMPNSDAQFLETRKFQIEEICRIFQVPPHMVADLSKSSFSNIENQSISFVVHTVRPWLVRIEQAMNRKLFKVEEKGQCFVSFNASALMRGDYKSRMDGYAIGIQNGFFSVNDVRRMENLDPIPAEEGGDLYLTNGNMLPLKMAGAYAKKALQESGVEGNDAVGEKTP